MSQGTRKLYIDSRFATTGTSSAFELDLGDNLVLGERPMALVSEATIPSSWHTIQEDRNDRLYVVEKAPGAASHAVRVCIVQSGAHDAETLRVALEAALNTNRPGSIGAYSVVRSNSLGTTSTSSLGAAYRYYTVSVTGGSTFFIATDAWLSTNYTATGFHKKNPMSINEIVSFQSQTLASIQVSSFVDLRGVHTVFIHMPGFTSYSALTPIGSRSSVAKVPVDAAYGGLVHYQHSGSSLEFFDVASKSIRWLTVELRDVRGNIVDLQGAHWSMTLVLAER